jgi:hypothetical protein
VLVVDEAVKDALRRTLREETEVAPRVRAFKELVKVVLAKGLPGGGRFEEANDERLGELLLAFRPLFRDPLPGKAWHWRLALAPSASAMLRGAVADLSAHGGDGTTILIRRPRRGMGTLVPAGRAELKGPGFV